MDNKKVLIIGGGLAGSDAAYFLASRGISVILAECKTKKLGPAQKIKTCAELVCTNSLKSSDNNSAHGLLKNEMEKLGSLVLLKAKESKVPAGSALAVDRNEFSKKVSGVLREHPLIEFLDIEVVDPIELAIKLDCYYTIIATGPLTTAPLTNWLKNNISGDSFYFYDSIAPIVDADSLDFSKLYFKNRYEDRSEEEIPDYLNLPLTKEEYINFVNALKLAKKVPIASFEKLKFFEACLPIDVLAERGMDTLRFSCMKPVGLEQESGIRPYAVVQLRKENLEGNAYNLVGFQNRLTYGEQVRVFGGLPGFSNASWLHLGSVHRNTFLNSKKLLRYDFSSREFSRLYFSGQITGVEGYTESAAMGLYVASQIYRKIYNKSSVTWPKETAIGALVNYIMTAKKPRPSNINFGLLPNYPLGKKLKSKDKKDKKKLKKQIASERVRKVFDDFFEENNLC